ncbi:MAG: hypothetical protein DHS20C12_29510 [Pseudohongiella sp.]|nr:MAG: hypothetical protein DHS20C12_29510 [Pseudohongiella sp.]
MKRKIVGYHLDDADDWVAELECQHGQHVRHKPPFTSRPWTQSENGRAAMLGTTLDCKLCEIRITSPRLLLRAWKPSDYEEFAKLNADPQVMEFFPNVLNREQSDALAERIDGEIKTRGWGFWALEELAGHADNFLGFVGLSMSEDIGFGPCVEIGWRLSRSIWGKGYGSEAACAALSYGFSTLHLDEVVSFTALENARSMKLMQRIGMTNTHRNFQHPKLAPGHRLQEHVLYTISKEQWSELKGTQQGARYVN